MTRVRVTRAAALLALAAGALATGTSSAQAQALDVIRWPTSASVVELIGPPDDRAVGENPYREESAAKFRCGVPYANLAALLRVPVATLAAADVIAFEFNGGHPGESGGWESSKWLFSDGTGALTVVWDAVAGASMPAGIVIGNGSVAGADYDRYFGIAAGSAPPVVSFILFDLPPTLATGSLGFQVLVKGYPSGEGDPDPEAIGVFARGCGLSE